ncbi:coproporphyrinogen III oxidase [Microsporum canis CBS 113480]|uniref:coproporphyrinogen oxidase n=1 Tax=Arthroderma otae (strain ATCC MYA-4605 / CBS 113480) TaxID=554155 RepID=C5FRJ0_ARTOC|nr:coproporphyrinogen III oxidase [Microsporum canis CBS 113480]EEQ32493.1 coproporphyrinogen III oxidase [Microsporum canis CBS 113480]
MATPRISAILSRNLRRVPFAQYQCLRNTRRQAHSIASGYVGSSRRALPFIGFATAFTALALYSTSSSTPISLEAPTIAKLDEQTKRQTEITSSSPMRLRMEKMIKEQQMRIIDELSKVDGKSFTIDEWNRPDGGGGISCVLQDGNVFEKAGVNVSVVYGKLPRPAIEKMRADHKSFVSADVDLRHLWLPFQPRKRKSVSSSFVTDGLSSFLPSYVPILKKRKDMPFTEQEKDWQQLRRGRYVEFNLVHDRGTSFGLRTPGARIESILMSLPRTAKWVYMDPLSGTRTDGVEVAVEGMEKEKELLEVLKQPKEWV